MSRLKDLDQALEDVEARFLYNLPASELNQVDRFFFQLEQAWWFYEDFMADVNPALPHFASLKTFAEKIFSHCPLLSQSHDKFVELFNNFNSYKSQIPVCGCIMLNPEMTKAVLVCTWKGKSWGFPRGKINENEEPLDCAVREAMEECGYDASQQCREEDQLVVMEESKTIKLFIATNVPESTIFTPQTRKEISEACFFSFDEFPKSTYAVHPFMPKLKRWISLKQKALAKSNANAKKDKKGKSFTTAPVTLSPKKPAAPKEYINFDSRNADTFAEEITRGSNGWGVSDMFKANARLTGLRYEYDGNPHSFGVYHPQFVDYSKKDKDDERAGKIIPSSSARGHGKNGEEGTSLINGMEVFNVPTTPPPSNNKQPRKRKVKEAKESKVGDTLAAALPSGWIGSRLPSPFKFDKPLIIGAVDAVLRETAATIVFDY
jgi:mRNA-decapping enzyme subunit 2